MLINSILTRKKDKNVDDDVMIDLSSTNFAIPDDFTYRLVRVSDMHKARPDLISQYVYGDDQYGDLLCKLNGISNPFELNEGDVLVVPTLEYIDDFFQEDSWDETMWSSSNKDALKVKTRKEKRQPNESIIGDTRYKIDLTNRVIIY